MTALFSYWPVALVIGAAVWILFFRKDQFDDYKDRVVTPPCFRSNPGPQQQAENDCTSCPWQRLCLVKLDDMLPPHLRANRVPAVSMFDRGICSACGATWFSTDGKCHLCRRGHEFVPPMTTQSTGDDA